MVTKDDLEQKVDLLLENLNLRLREQDLSQENKQLKSKVLQLEKQLQPFQKRKEEEFTPITDAKIEKLGKILGGVLTVGVLAGLGYFFYSLAYSTDSRSAQSRYEQRVKLRDERDEAIDELPQHYDKAMDELGETIRRNPNDADAYRRRGELHLNFGEYGKAVRDFSKAIDLNPDNGDYLYSRATAHCYLGNEDAAAFDINTLAVLGSTATPPQLYSTVQLGKCFFLQGNYDLAKEFGYQGGEE